MNTKHLQGGDRKRVKRALRQHRLRARALRMHGVHANRAAGQLWRAQRALALAWNRWARTAGAPQISAITLRPHSEPTP